MVNVEQTSPDRLLTAANAAVAARARPEGPDPPSLHFEAIYTAYAPLLRKIAMRKLGDSSGRLRCRAKLRTEEASPLLWIEPHGRQAYQEIDSVIGRLSQ